MSRRSTVATWTLLAALSLGACKRDTVMMANADVSASPGQLDFGRLALGTPLALEIEVSNRGRAPAPLSLAVTGPFLLGVPPPTEVGGGSSQKISIGFAPTQLGTATGTLSLGEGLPEVALRGEGVPPCVAPAPCTEPRFELTTRTCVADPAADGVACTAPCLSGGAGTCLGGLCLGLATQCVDGDACTYDACDDDGGCLNPPLDCPVVDRCQAAFCDRATGCGSLALEDGTPCGEAVCEWAEVCFGGRCERRLRPNADLDCRYTMVAAGPQHTCAVTVGHALRCWGENLFDQQGRGFEQEIAPPGIAASFTGVRSVAAADATTWVSREPGEIAQTNGSARLPIDAGALSVSAAGLVCGLEHGVVRCGDDAGITSVIGDTLAFSASDLGPGGAELCVVRTDGGVWCGRRGSLVAVPGIGPATDVTVAGGTACALVTGQGVCWGALVDGGPVVVWDAGVTAIAAHTRSTGRDLYACAALGSRVDCLPAHPLRQPTGALPATVTRLALGDFHVCALTIDGLVACWGENTFGELGDRSNQPLGVQLRSLRATWLTAIDDSLVFDADGGLWALARIQLIIDAGSRWELMQPMPLPERRDDSAHGCLCQRRDGGVFCGGIGPLAAGAPVACEHVGRAPNREQACVSASNGMVRCFEQGDGGPFEAAAWDAGGEVIALRQSPQGGMCALRADGQVRCRDLDDASPPESLEHVVDLCLGDPTWGGGCARLDGGALSCWGPWVGAATPRAPAGAWPISRGVACGHRHFCSLSGINIVQCWGDNRLGQLGRDGPSTVQAVSVPMPEGVRSIAAAFSHTCALLESGTLACWGDNYGGSLGVPALESTSTPRLVRE